MLCKRYEIDLGPPDRKYQSGAVLGLMKGMAKGQAVVVAFHEEEMKVVVRVKAGTEAFFIGQTESYGWRVREVQAFGRIKIAR